MAKPTKEDKFVTAVKAVLKGANPHQVADALIADSKNNQLPDPPAEIVINLENNEKENTMETTITRIQMISTAKQMNRIFSYTPEEAINVKGESKGGLTDDVLKSFIIDNGTQLEATDFEFHDDDADFIPFDDDAKAVFTAFGVLIPLKPKAIVKDEKGKTMKPTAKAKTEGKDKYTRAKAFADAVKSGETNLEKLLTVADELFMAANDKPSNIKEAKWYQSTVVSGLVALGLYTVSEGCLIAAK